MRHLLILIAFVFIASANVASRRGDEWPDPYAYWNCKVNKTDGLEMTDVRWFHLHNGEGAADDVTVQMYCDHLINQPLFDATGTIALDEDEIEDELDMEVRYTVAGVPVSDWLTEYPFSFTLENDDADLPAAGGIYDFSLEIRVNGTTPADPPAMAPFGCNCDDRYDFAPYASFLHLGGRETEATTAPVIPQNEQETLLIQARGTNYIPSASFPTLTGFPAATTLTRWTTTPMYSQEDLWQEMMQPGNEQFVGQQMWWQEPAGTIDAGMLFLRSMDAKAGEGFLSLWNFGGQVDYANHGYTGHQSFPVKDGPRGVGWTNGYIQGVCEDQAALGEGNYCFFVNISGQLRVLHPDGELTTIVGWRVPPGQGAIWFLKPMTSIRAGMEFRGTITNGEWADAINPGWHQPMDVAVNPADPEVLYVAAYYDNAIYKVDLDRDTWEGTVSVLAGDPNHSSGYTDHATGTSARFFGPISLVTSLDGAWLYVSEHNNDAIRKINTATGATTTIHKTTGLSAALNGDTGVSCGTDERTVCWSATGPLNAVRASSDVTLEGASYTLYFPGPIRITSTGDLVLYDYGLKTLRYIDLGSNDGTDDAATIITDVMGDGGALGNGAFGEWARGWVWLDVDRWGAVGPQDSVYFGNATTLDPPPGDEVQGRFNEDYRFATVYTDVSSWIFGSSQNGRPVGQGPPGLSRPPHYPWLLMVDPNGALYVAGIGSHGITRIRKRRSSDPTYAQTLSDVASERERDWRFLVVGGTRGPFSSSGEYDLRTEIDTASSLSIFYGWNLHNIIGLPDAWLFDQDSTDEEIDAGMDWPAEIANDAQSLEMARLYARFHANSEAAPEDPPGDPPDPAIRRFPLRIKGGDVLPVLFLVPLAGLLVTLTTRRSV